MIEVTRLYRKETKHRLLQQALASPIPFPVSVQLRSLRSAKGLTIPMMQIQIDIKDTVKFLAQPQDPQDSIIQVTEARSFVSVKTVSVRYNIANAIATDHSAVTFTS